jgi:hypothetical protein
MDKQKQIEGIAKLLDGYWSTKSKCPFDKKCPYLGGSVRFTCNDCLRAYTIYNAGYRKIPENAVVLMGTETEQRFEDLMVAFDEMGFMPNTTHPFPEEYVETWKQRLIFVFGQLRKETAEKFAERVKMAFYYEFDELIPSIMEDKIDEICKEIIGEV